MTSNGQDPTIRLARARQALADARQFAAQAQVDLAESDPIAYDIDCFQRVLDTVVEGCFLVGFDWRYLYINDSAARQTRREKADLIGTKVTDAFPEVVDTPLFAMMHRCMEARSIEHTEQEYILPDGSSAWFELRMQPVRLGVFVVSLDITERKRTIAAADTWQKTLEQRVAERTSELQAANKRLQAILDHSADGIAFVGVDLTIEKSNEAFRTLFARSQSADPGQPLADLLDSDPERLLAAIHKGLAEGGKTELEVRARRSDGTVFDADLRIGFVRDDGLVCSIRDITARKTQERELQFQIGLQENLSDAVIVTDLDFRIRSWNRAAERIYGWTAEEVVDKETVAVLRTAFPNAADRAESMRQLDENGWWRGEAIQNHKDGTFRNILGSVTLIKDASGQSVGVVAVNHDITDRKRADNELAEERNRLRAVIDAVQDYIYVKDTQHRFVLCNQAFAALNGHTTPDEMIGKTNFDYFPQASAEAFHADEVRILETGQPLVEQEQALIGYQSVKWVALNKFPLRNLNGETIGLVCLTRDISERKRVEQSLVESELRYRLLAENVSDVIAKVNGQGIRTFVTPSVRMLLGYEPEELIGRQSAEIVHPDDLPHSQAIVEAKMLTDDAPFMLVQRLRHKSGAYIWVEGKYSVVRDPVSGTVVETIGVIRDISGLKQAEAVRVERLQEEREFQAHLMALQEITIELTQIDSLEEFYSRAVAFGRERLGFERLAMFLYDDHEKIAIGTYGTDTAGNQTDERNIKFTPNPTGALMRAFTKVERFYFDDDVPLYHDMQPVGTGWNAAAVLWNGTENLGWLVADNYFTHSPAKASQMDILGLYALTVGTLLAQKRVQLALRESEQRFRQIAENIDQVLFIRSADNRDMLYINPRYETMWGRSCESLYENANSFIDIVHPDDRDFVQQQFTTRRFVEEGFADFEYRIVPPDGQVHWVHAHIFPIRDETGTLVRRAGLVEDITERRRIADELERQRLFLQNVIDVSPTLIFVKDRDARFVLANPMVARIYGTTVDALIGKTDHALAPVAEEAAAFQEADRRVIESGKPLDIEESLTNHAGETYWLQTTKVPIVSADGRSKYVLGVSTDITERKRTEAALRASEEKYRQLIETMRGGLLIYDLDDRITYANDRVCELFGYSRDEVLGAYPYDFVPPEFVETVKEQLRLRKRAEHNSYEVIATRKNGQQVHLLVAGSPLLDSSGKLIGSFAVTTDITAQKQAEEALREAFQKEKELGDLKTRFVSMASHEFRTPLATILALTETLSTYRHRMQEGQINERFERIKDQVGHLRDIMEDVLLLSRMQARRTGYNPVIVDLDGLCRGIVGEFQAREDVAHRIEYTCGPDAYTVKLDQKLIRQVVANILSNAMKYSPSDKPVSVSVDYGAEEVAIRVRDQGIGIPEADLKHLFEPFHRAANVGTISGTGLGLVIARESVEMHGGTIDVESRENVGTTFTIRIPKETLDALPDQANDRPPTEPKPVTRPHV